MKNIFSNPLLFLVLWLTGGTLLAQTSDELPRIAHAGGQIGNATYTNSIEALDTNYAIGFRAFEIDFSWTSDEQLVCLHDWEQSFERSFGFKQSSAVSLSEFESLVSERSEFNKCTLESLVKWMTDHPDTLLITDVKERNLDALELISVEYPELMSRVIPQIYQPQEYTQTKRFGYEDIIWTLYLYASGSQAVIDTAKSMDLWAITMDINRAGQGLGQSLKMLGVPTYVHTINDYADMLFFKSEGIDEIYTDRLSVSAEKQFAALGEVSIADSRLYLARETKSQALQQSIKEFFENSVLHYSLEDNFVAADVRMNQLTVTNADPRQLQLNATGNDPYLVFPTLSDPQKAIEVYIQLDLPDSTVVEIFYATEEQPNFSAALRVNERVRQGSNELVFQLADPSPINRIRLDLGTLQGDYSIGRFEIRSD